MGKKRSRSDIIEDMLKAIMHKGGSIKPTHLMYKSNMSHKQMQLYLKDLIASKLVEILPDGDYERVHLTDKGAMYIAKLQEIKDFEHTFGLT
ncbi:MAG: winged helix-turn-helix domain-containing protein [Candidatus Woesearchaeota archaeon]